MTDYRNPAWTEESPFRGGLDDVIIVPLVFVTLAANKILRSISFDLDTACSTTPSPLTDAESSGKLPLIAARVLGNVISYCHKRSAFAPPSSFRRRSRGRRWSISIRQKLVAPQAEDQPHRAFPNELCMTPSKAA